ncbi:MAG: ammonium transporter [Candidatus Accumulibacter sp.]|jgi:Amt family ammonium transporter|nr:ammonium transporter [Accumulibacter sp.]
MKKILTVFTPVCAALLSSPVWAEISAVATPVISKADNAWILISAALVILMSIPGLALFYGGLVRSKNMLSVLMQVFVTFSLISVLWVIYGYSLAFADGGNFFGSFDKVFLKGVTVDSLAGTFSKGVYISEFTYIVFQGAFAAITCGLIIGAFAERARFSAVLLFMVLWFTFSYLPLARMVWYWAGPDAYVDAAAAEAAGKTAGFLFQKGALDFAGGTVVHINAAIAGLVGAYMIGKRVGYHRESMAPHSLSLTMIGTSLLWFGWFGFNAGSALEANGSASLAMLNTLVATACATLSWMLSEWKLKGHPSMLGAASGAVAGLVTITPGAGFVGIGGAIFIGLLSGVVCLWGVNGLKRMLSVDDSLDVFGVHGLGGILGSLLTGIFCSPALGGSGIYDYVTGTVGEYDMTAQMISQTWGVLVAIVWSGAVSFAAYRIIDLLIGLRVPEEEEREGLDITTHGESAYHF